MSEPAIVVQARLGSTRFPRKVLADLAGAPMLLRILDRLRAVQGTRIAVATSTHTDDDELVRIVEAAGVTVVRGPLDDVLARYAAAAAELDADAVVRITADCPFVDPGIVTAVLDAHRGASVAYAGNIEPPTFPDGLDVEVMSRAALEQADREATTTSDREHVTLYLRERPDRFPRVNVENDRDRSAQRWTVDYPKDLEFARSVYAELDPLAFRYDDVEELLRTRPDLERLQPRVARNERLGQG